MMNSKNYFLIAFFLLFAHLSFSQTTVNLADQCNCEVFKDGPVTNGNTSPTGADTGDLLVDTLSGVTYYWDGDSWEGSPSPVDTVQTDYTQHIMAPDIYEPSPINTPSASDTTAIFADTLMVNIDTMTNIGDGKDHDWYVHNNGVKTYNQAYNIHRSLWTYGALVGEIEVQSLLAF